MPSPGRTVLGAGRSGQLLDHTSDSFKAADTNVQRMRLRESRAAACRSLAEGSMCPLCSLTSRHQQPSVHRPACVRRTRTKSAGAIHPRRKVPTRRHASCRVRWAREAPQESVAAGPTSECAAHLLQPRNRRVGAHGLGRHRLVFSRNLAQHMHAGTASLRTKTRRTCLLHKSAPRIEMD